MPRAFSGERQVWSRSCVQHGCPSCGKVSSGPQRRDVQVYLLGGQRMRGPRGKAGTGPCPLCLSRDPALPSCLLSVSFGTQGTPLKLVGFVCAELGRCADWGRGGISCFRCCTSDHCLRDGWGPGGRTGPWTLPAADRRVPPGRPRSRAAEGQQKCLPWDVFCRGGTAACPQKTPVSPPDSFRGFSSYLNARERLVSLDNVTWSVNDGQCPPGAGGIRVLGAGAVSTETLSPNSVPLCAH